MIGQVLGADPGSKISAYAIIDLATGQLLAADCLRMRNVADADLRLEELSRLWGAFWQPGNLFRNVTHLYIEGGFAGKFRNVADQLAIARHYMRLPAKLRGIVVGPEPAPTTVKKHLVGDGAAGKEAMLAFCRERYQRDFASPDVADAIGVATYGYQEVLRVDKLAVARALLDRPNEQMTWEAFDRTQAMHWLIFRETFCMFEMAGQVPPEVGVLVDFAPVGVWPVAPFAVAHVPTRNLPSLRIWFRGHLFLVSADLVQWESEIRGEGARR